MPATALAQNRQHAVSFKRVLLATDFSDASQPTLPWALAIARQYRSEVFLVHAIPPEVREQITLDPLPPELDRRRIEAEQSLNNLAHELRSQHISSHTLLRQGPTSAVICSVIQRENIDLLVLGTHGRGGVKKLALGSVAEELLRLAPCPVLTIGKNVGPAMSPTVNFQRILFATDFGPGATRALPYVLSLAAEHRAQVVFLHMVPPMPIADFGPAAYCPPAYMAEEIARWETTQRQESANKLKALIPAETRLPCQPEYVVATNFTPGSILTVAAKHNVDLIAMGANPTASARSTAHLPWTVVHHVISEARCPVLTVMA